MPAPNRKELAAIDKGMEWGAGVPSYIITLDLDGRPHIIDGKIQYARKKAKHLPIFVIRFEDIKAAAWKGNVSDYQFVQNEAHRHTTKHRPSR